MKTAEQANAQRFFTPYTKTLQKSSLNKETSDFGGIRAILQYYNTDLDHTSASCSKGKNPLKPIHPLKVFGKIIVHYGRSG